MTKFQLSHSSYPSSIPDEYNCCQSVSIDPFSQKQVGKKIFYEGKASSDQHWADDKHGAIMSVAFSAEDYSDRKWAENEAKIIGISQTMARKFNRMMRCIVASSNDKMKLFQGNGPKTIGFRNIQIAELESVSFTDRKRREGEFFVYTQKNGKIETFVDTAIESSKANSSGKRRHRKRFNCGTNVCHELLQAFVHHSYCNCHAQLALDHLHGFYDGCRGYSLLVPTIHSMDKSNGTGDLGEEGIRQVIENHTCNELCHHLPAMRVLFNNLKHEASRRYG